ncbi:glycosyltransferase family 2 protein, partial [Vibrio parahaemolyticus]
MPVYNVGAYVAESIESILNQTYSNFELIIIDDCSTDNTVDMCLKYQLIDSRV